ncbi:MAG: DNA gyrase inhibitor YacG [Paracoccaceae bacterium]
MSCPICKKPAAPRYRPFCSRRCADLDLARWLDGSYALASEDPLDDTPDSLDTPPDPAFRRH